MKVGQWNMRVSRAELGLACMYGSSVGGQALRIHQRAQVIRESAQNVLTCGTAAAGFLAEVSIAGGAPGPLLQVSHLHRQA